MCACSAPFAFLRLSSLVNDLNLYTVVDSNPSVSWSLHPKLHFFLFKHKMGLEYEYLVIYIYRYMNHHFCVKSHWFLVMSGHVE